MASSHIAIKLKGLIMKSDGVMGGAEGAPKRMRAPLHNDQTDLSFNE
jgi:hypothetical protein